MSEGNDKCRVCSAPTSNKCSSCRMVSYCGREHQKEDWNNHRDACRAFEVKQSSELGRYLEANRRISPGDVIFSELPIVYGPRLDDFVCLGCYSPDPRERCPRCLWPACSACCSGLTEAEHHGAECLVLSIYAKRVKFIRDDFFRFGAVLPLRCLLLQARNPKKWKILMEMESHAKKRAPGTEAHEQSRKIAEYLHENFFKLLERIESETDAKLISDRSPDTIHKICGIIDVNALEVNLAKDTSINALYPTAYLMEHSCLPNTRHTFQCQPSKHFRITVLANQDIPPGSHISTMYTHALWGTQQRQEHLRSTKYFTCRCRRCGDPSELGTSLSALRCLAPDVNGKICGGVQLPVSPLDATTEWRCEKCPTTLTSPQVAELVNMIGHEVDLVQENKPTVESLHGLLEKLRKLLHRNHYHCYAVMHSLVQLYGRQQGYLPDQMNDLLLDMKIKMCKELLWTTRQLDPTGSRLSLYSSVVEVELASSWMIIAKRKTWSGAELLEKMKDIRNCLLRAKESLAPEEEGSPGHKIALIADENLSEVEAFCRIHNISL